MKGAMVLFLIGMATILLTMVIAVHAQPASPLVHKAPPAIIHHAPSQQPRIVYVDRPREDWGLGSWLAAPFNAIGVGVGTVAASVGNVVEAPFIAVGQAWGDNNCWREMVDRRTGETKLMWICK